MVQQKWFVLLEADKGRMTRIISKKQVHEMVEQELN